MKARYTAAAAIAAALLSAGGATAGTLVTGAKIKDGTVTSRDIKDGSLLAADFKRGQLPAGAPGRDGVNGRDGAPGPAGPQGPAPSGTPKVTALPDIAMKPDDPGRSVATVGPFPYRMFCNRAAFNPFLDYSISGGVTVRSDAGFFWTFNGDAWKANDEFGGDSTSTDISGPGGEAWSLNGSVARIVGDFAVNAGGCTLSNAKVYVW
jgi:hypothetical protein